MLFNSLPYLFFLPIVFTIYWLVNAKSLKLQNLLLLAASYYFYSCWDWRFLFLLVFSTVLDYYTGLKMKDAANANIKKFWFWLSIGINVGFLGIFKYYNFFAESFADLLSGIGFQANFWTLQVILPVGISFYTFHGLSYVIDIYKDRIEPERNIVDYSLFVSYFPLLVAGPIERATHLLPQLKKRRNFNYDQAFLGIRQIIWGLFKKVVIADSCALYANQIFDNYEQMDSLTLVLGAVYFAFQIYGDFSGYSDIALGTSKLFGIELLKNFSYPYFSRDIAEFWRRWHISLSSWFRDYLYIPLGGSQGGKRMQVRNTFVIFLVSGFWHGANWTFVVWGLINAVYFLPLLLTEKNRSNIDTVTIPGNLQGLKTLGNILITFALVCLAWIFFRAESIGDAVGYIKGIFQFQFSINSLKDFVSYDLVLLLLFFIYMEWSNKNTECPLNKRHSMVKLIVTLLLIILFGQFGVKSEFIYFQF